MTATTCKSDTLTWEDVDWVDLQPLPGSFVSPTYDDYEIRGRIIHALNYAHAEYTALKQDCEAAGEEFARCCHCNHYIRYAVIFEDSATGLRHLVGQDCAKFINSRLNLKKYREQQFLADVKPVNTKNGERFTLKINEIPFKYWDLPREQRPKYCSVSKYEKRGGRSGREVVWTMTIWGATPAEVRDNYLAFKKLVRQNSG